MNEVVLNELPDSWEWTKLGDVVTKIIGGGTPSKNKPQYWEGDIPWLTVKDMRSRRPADAMDHISVKAVEESSTNIIPEDTVIIATRIGLGKVIRVPYKAAINQDLKALVVPPQIDNGYLEYWFVSKTHYLESIGSGTTVKGIRLEQVRDLDFPRAPPEQQKRIVAKIEELFSHIDAGIEALKKAKQLLKQYRQSVLKSAVTGELTKEWREANKDNLEPASQLLERILKERHKKWEEQQLEQFKVKGKMPKNDKWKEKYKEPVSTRDWAFLSEIPDSWSWVSVDQIGDSQDQPVLTGPFGSNLGKGDFTQEGVPVLTIGCLQEEGIDLSRAMHVSKKKAEELERYQLKEGDMLFSRMAAVGRAGFVTPELEGALFNYHIMRLRLHPHAILQEYFVSYVRGSSQVYDYVKEVNHGATRDGINTQQLLEMPVALAPLQEQKEICKVVGEKLSAIRRLESDIDIQMLKAEKNKESILASAFCGKLSNNDNSAKDELHEEAVAI